MRTPVGGKVLGMREFSAWLGLSPGWLSAFKTRTKKGLEPKIDHETARKIQAKTGARIEWIVGDSEQWERYPEREDALRGYRDLPPAVVAEVRSMSFHSQASPSAERWKSYIDATLIAYHRGELMGEAVNVDDEPPAND